MNWTEMRKLHPELPKSSKGWHKHANGGGWVHKNAIVAKTVFVGEPALIWDGMFYDGEHVSQPMRIFGSQYPIGWSGVPGMIRSGCLLLPLKDWTKKGGVEKIAAKHGYTKEQQKEYRIYVKAIAAWMKLKGVDKEKP